MKFPTRCKHSMWLEHPEFYQKPIYDFAMKFVRNRAVAIDCGAHVGIFTRRMEDDFAIVHSFEPAKDNFACLKENARHAALHNVCLWDKPACLAMRFEDHENSGANEVIKGEAGTYNALPLDWYQIKDAGLIKLDVQGSEIETLMGAVETLKSRPVLIVECVDEAPADYCKSIGYREVGRARRDRVFVCS